MNAGLCCSYKTIYKTICKLEEKTFKNFKKNLGLPYKVRKQENLRHVLCILDGH